MAKPPFGSGPGAGSLLSRGISARRAGRLSEAEKLFVAATRIDPGGPDAHYQLAAIRSHRSRHAEALRPIQRALKLDSSRAEFHALHGSIQIGLGAPARAREALKRALALRPSVALHWFLFGVALAQLEDQAAAVRAYRKAIALDPSQVGPWCNLGAILVGLGEPVEAVACCEKAVALDPGHMLSWMNLGRALCDVGGQARAVTCYERALELAPEHPAVLTNLGQALRELGRVDEAITAFRRALRTAPDMTHTRLMLAATRRHDQRDDEVERIETIARDPGAHGVAPHDALFAHAKVLADLGADGAFDVLVRANAERRRTYTYSVDEDAEAFQRIREVFTPARIAALAGAGCPDPTPIFVLGMPRSGTSLVEQVLASHPDIEGAGELELLRLILDAAPFERPYPEGFATVGADALTSAGARYVELLRGRAGGARFVVDKMPRNFVHLGAIRAILPGARIVHCARDPRDTCVSNFEQNFRATLPFAFDLAELGRYHRLHDELMDHWRAVLGPDAFLEVRYEDLVTDFESQVRRLLAYVGVGWDGACLEFHRSPRPVSTASMDQVRRPVHGESIQRWRRWEERLGPLLEALGSPVGR